VVGDAEETTVKLVSLSEISVDSGTQIRAAIDQQVVADYAEAMTNGAQFPPVVLFHDGNTHHVGDGFHRIMAAQRNQFRDIPADVRVGTQQDALWFALGANKQHGKQLTSADKKRAIIVALTTWPNRSNRELAAQIGCSDVYISRIRSTDQNTFAPAGARVIGRDGKSYPVSTPQPKRGEVSEQRKAVAAMVREGASAGDIRKKLNAHTSLIAEVRRELGVQVVDKSRKAIADRRDQMRKMAEKGYTSRQIAAALGLSEDGCRATMRELGIDISADRAVGKTKRHDSNRILTQIVMDAENLTEGVNLIDFADIDRSQIPDWLRSLQESRDKLGAFIRRLMKEQQKNGEAA
jgi:DNA-binding NarL/FixJ family response regulator